jgi:hypothetical protein
MLFIRRLPEVISVFRLGSFGREPGRSASGVLHFLGWKLLFAEANRIILSNSAQVKSSGQLAGRLPLWRGLFAITFPRLV